MKQSVVGRKLVLHFDLNKTILLADARYPNQTKEECVSMNNFFKWYAWGRLEQRDEKSPIQWKLSHPSFTATRPSEDVISYKEYIAQQYALKQGEGEEVKEYNDSMIEQRRTFYYTFVKQGSPCMKLKPEFDRIVKTLTLPKAVMEELKQKMEDPNEGLSPEEIKKRTFTALLQENDHLGDLFADGKYYLLPNFYKTVINLKKQKREFAIVFRPFGTDPKNVIREFNRFCLGVHPCFSGRNNTPIVKFDGSKGTKNYMIMERQTGMFYRFEGDMNKTALAMGTLRRVDKEKALEDEYEKEIEEESVTLQKSPGNIFVQMMEQLKESCGLCLQDDFTFYEHHEAIEDNAKLLLIDPSDYDTQHIFFDDNVHDSDNLNLVEVIDAIGGEKISRKRCLNKYLVRVDIIDAIKDPDYFIKLIDQCERARAEEIDRIERGIVEDAAEVVRKTDWELLQESSDAEYLRATIMPLLYQSLRLVDMERPKDPLSFIAMYCLKNKERVKIPQPTQDYLDAIAAKEEEQQQLLQQQQPQPVVEAEPIKQVPVGDKKK